MAPVKFLEIETQTYTYTTYRIHFYLWKPQYLKLQEEKWGTKYYT